MAAPPSTPTIPLDVLSRQNAPTVLDVIRVFNDNVGYINVRSQTTTASVPGVTTLGSRAGSPYPHTFGAQSANVLMDGFGSALARLVDVSDDARVALAVFLKSTRYSVLHGVDTEPGLQSYLHGLYVQSLNLILRDAAHFAPGDAPGGNWTFAFSPGGGRADFEYRLNGTLVAAGEIKPSSAASDHLIRQEMPTDAPHANIYMNMKGRGTTPLGVHVQGQRTLVGGHLFQVWTQLVTRQLRYLFFTNGNVWLPLRVMDKIYVLDKGISCEPRVGTFDPLTTPLGFLLALSLLPVAQYSYPLSAPVQLPAVAAATATHTIPNASLVASLPSTKSEVLPSAPFSSPCIIVRLLDEVLGPHSLDMVDIETGSPGVVLTKVKHGWLETAAETLPTGTTGTLAPPPTAASGTVPDDTTPVVAITHCLGRGGTSDVYAAVTVPGVPWPVAAKLSVPFAEAMRVNSDSATRISAEDISLAERQVRFMHATEALVLAGPLAKLQGVAVPRFFGAYHALVPHSAYSQDWALAPEASVELWATVMERTERVDFHSMTAADKLAIVGRYRQIHAAGVLHRDPGARHWHRSIEDGRMLVIDFGVSMTRDDIGDGFDVWARDELKQVKEMLGLREPRR